MSKQIIGIDIREDSLSCLSLRTGFHGNWIEGFVHLPLAKAEGDEGLSLEDALYQATEAIETAGALCVASIPPDRISYRSLHVPFRDAKKIRQIIPFELESTLPMPIEEMAIDFQIIDLPSPSEGTDLIAGAVTHGAIRHYLNRLKAIRIDPEVLTVAGYATVLSLARIADVPENWLYLDLDHRKCSLFLLMSGQVCLARSLPIGLLGKGRVESVCTHIQRTLAAFADGHDPDYQPEEIHVSGFGLGDGDFEQRAQRILGMPVKRADLLRDAGLLKKARPSASLGEPKREMDHALALALVPVENTQPLNFRRGPFASTRPWDTYRGPIIRTALMIGLVLIASLANVIIEASATKKKLAAVDQEIHQIIRTTFPDMERIVDPLHQMQVAMADLQNAAVTPGQDRKAIRTIDILNEISRRVPDDIDVELTRMVIGDDSVLISGDTDTFNAVDAVQSRLSESERFQKVTISSTNKERTGDRIQFKMRIEL